MYHVRPVLRDFALWLIMTPLFLVEILAFQSLQQNLALDDPAQVRQTFGQVVEYRQSHQFNRPDRYEVRYCFHIPNDPTCYTSNNGFGQHNLPVDIDPHEWQESQQNNNRLLIRYLLSDPSINRPEAQFNQVPASVFLWAVLLVHNGNWFIELFHICRNYLRCLAAAEQQQVCIVRFWRTRLLQ